MMSGMHALLAATSKPNSPDLLSPAFKGFFHGVLAVWPLWLVIGLAALGKLAYQLYRLRRLSRSGIAEIDRMDGQTFETFLGTLFRRLGYAVEITRYRGDYGADLVVARNGKRTAVQAKRWSKRVGVKAVQEAVAAKGYYNCDAALVVANREFTQQARRLAHANKVELWDRDVLVGKLLAARGEEQIVEPSPQLLDASPLVPTSPPLREPTAANPALAPPPSVAGDNLIAEGTRCVTCGDAVSDKVRDYCLARPAHFGGRIYCYAHQRTTRPALAPSE
jgi:restriction system protein